MKERRKKGGKEKLKDLKIGRVRKEIKEEEEKEGNKNEWQNVKSKNPKGKKEKKGKWKCLEPGKRRRGIKGRG